MERRDINLEAHLGIKWPPKGARVFKHSITKAPHGESAQRRPTAAPLILWRCAALSAEPSLPCTPCAQLNGLAAQDSLHPCALFGALRPT